MADRLTVSTSASWAALMGSRMPVCLLGWSPACTSTWLPSWHGTLWQSHWLRIKSRHGSEIVVSRQSEICLPAFLPVGMSGRLPVRLEDFAEGPAPLDRGLRTLHSLTVRACSIKRSNALFPLPGTFEPCSARAIFPFRGHPLPKWAVRPPTPSVKKAAHYQCGRVKTLLEVVA